MRTLNGNPVIYEMTDEHVHLIVTAARSFMVGVRTSRGGVLLSRREATELRDALSELLAEDKA